MNILVWLIGGIVGLGILGALGWFAFSMVSNTFRNERETYDRSFKMNRRDNRDLSLRIAKLEEMVKAQFSQFQTSLQSLHRHISEISGQNYQQEVYFAQQPEPKFPIAAEEYLSVIGGDLQTATADLISGVLVSNPDKGTEFLIVRDGELTDDLAYAVPNQTRFSTKSDFLNFYRSYYICENPSGGLVWIKTPATVRRVDEGWQLVEQGELEVK